MLTLAREAGLKRSSTCRQPLLLQRYFANSPDGLRRPKTAEELLFAVT
jgi:hypothetical protein